MSLVYILTSSLTLDFEKISEKSLGFSEDVDCEDLASFLEENLELDLGVDGGCYEDFYFVEDCCFLELDLERER